MMTTTAIQSVGNLGIFPSRAFLPAFLTALVMRLGPDMPLISRSQFLTDVAAAQGPTWFTNDITLIVLGVLALLEFIAQSNVDIRELMDEFDAWIKSAVSAMTTLGVITAQEVDLVSAVTGENLANLPVVAASAGGVFAAAKLRGAALQPIDEATPDDEFGLGRILNWIETFWVLLAVILMVVLPIVLFILTAIILLSLALLRSAWKKRETRTMLECTECGTKMHCSALQCPHCAHKNPHPCAVGFFGQSKPEQLAHPERQPYLLYEKKRCPQCATFLKTRQPRQACEACGHETLSEAGFAEEYDNMISQRRLQVLVACFLLSFIPVLGVIPGIIYYHTVLVAPYRRYLPFWRRFFSRLLLKFVLFCLLAFQWVPILGMLSIPLMAWLSHGFARGSWRKLVAQTTPAVSTQKSERRLADEHLDAT